MRFLHTSAKVLPPGQDVSARPATVKRKYLSPTGEKALPIAPGTVDQPRRDGRHSEELASVDFEGAVFLDV
jgi:hypothetical protein